MPPYIKEEGFFKTLSSLFPVLSGVIISVLLGDNYFSDENTATAPFYSCCAKIPTPSQEESGLVAVNLVIVYNITFCLVVLGIHIATFRRARLLEKQQSLNLPNMGNAKGDKDSSTHSLTMTKHRRNVVSPEASCVSFFVFAFYNLPISYYMSLHQGSSSTPVTGEILFFLQISLHFFVLNVIETVLSPTLRNSLIPWRKSEYHIVTV